MNGKQISLINGTSIIPYNSTCTLIKHYPDNSQREKEREREGKREEREREKVQQGNGISKMILFVETLAVTTTEGQIRYIMRTYIVYLHVVCILNLPPTPT